MDPFYIVTVSTADDIEAHLKLSAYEVLKMATVNGAKAMGMFDADILEVGKKADIIEIFTSQNSNDTNTKTNNDDFEDDFDLSYRISINKNIINQSINNDKQGNLFCYEKS